MDSRWQPRELRTVGRIVLACGLVLAALVYWVSARQRVTLLDDTNALGYSRAMDAQMTRLMGHFGVMMMGWNQSLSSPVGKALAVLVVTALLAGYFFRVAYVMEQEE